ncbi:MAG TPA: hypothetical protein PKC85_02110 [Bacteroidia bacterium]|jgi:hypothetical protein|nr:hypothetical protein [Bacteroidia bacterium]HMU18613.1 hypothetical protein [Bacteroidia bacterium]
MRDVFYTIVVVWVVIQIYKSFIKPKNNTTQRNTTRKEGDVTINTNTNNKNRNNNQGEYVDFEEIKD